MNFIFLNSLIIKTLPKLPNFGKVLPKKTDKSIIGKSSPQKKYYNHISASFIYTLQFCLKKTLFFFNFNLSNMENAADFFNLIPFLNI